ncbi:MAG: aldolase catalytic domain-containing protein, partial [Victivallales bacterium]|nr:aldolase catalytic domain-containing protein [Victivallales bacterium]
MNQVELLDCTLRDGGYAVKWNFGSNTIVNIFSRLVSSGVDIIELGYLRDWEVFDNNKTSLPKVKDFDAVFDVNFPHRPMLVAMIDLGNCRIENICDAKDTIIDGIRLTFKKARIDEAMEFARQIIAKGYKLFLQSVSITDYTDAEYLQLIERLNEVKPYAISIVDTYGLMFDYDLMQYFRLLDHNLDPEIRIGYHPHNNFQMAFANAVEIINGRSRHRLVIDTTVNGIGKDSGNACTELMAYYLNENFGRQFQISHLLEIIDSELSKLRERLTWGYSYIGFISATNHCRTEYTKYLLAKKTLSVASINTILSRIAPDKRTTAF